MSKLKENIFKSFYHAKFKNFSKLKYQKVNKSVVYHLLSTYLSFYHISTHIYFIYIFNWPLLLLDVVSFSFEDTLMSNSCRALCFDT